MPSTAILLAGLEVQRWSRIPYSNVQKLREHERAVQEQAFSASAWWLLGNHTVGARRRDVGLSPETRDKVSQPNCAAVGMQRWFHCFDAQAFDVPWLCPGLQIWQGRRQRQCKDDVPEGEPCSADLDGLQIPLTTIFHHGSSSIVAMLLAQHSIGGGADVLFCLLKMV